MANTKELLDNLKSIQTKSDTNPKPVFKTSVYPPVSNQYGEDQNGNPIYIDRMYGSLNGTSRLVQKDGSEYSGKIHKRRKSVKGKDGENFYTTVYETADGRWFDCGGMPIAEPTKIVKETEQTDER
tara:strand:- start:1127 stop:1504 length:378 start_codon:yes stop_codon:yes gene_type:complete